MFPDSGGLRKAVQLWIILKTNIYSLAYSSPGNVITALKFTISVINVEIDSVENIYKEKLLARPARSAMALENLQLFPLV